MIDLLCMTNKNYRFDKLSKRPYITKAKCIDFELKKDIISVCQYLNVKAAKAEHIKIMRESVPPHVGIKASGGIKTLQQAIQMIEAGADRLGTSSGISIVTSQTNL